MVRATQCGTIRNISLRVQPRKIVSHTLKISTEVRGDRSGINLCPFVQFVSDVNSRLRSDLVFSCCRFPMNWYTFYAPDLFSGLVKLKV